MTDLTPILNELLKSHEAPPTLTPPLAIKHIDSFLEEAYKINTGIIELYGFLKGIRQSYLSKEAPRRTNVVSQNKQWKYLTDRDREEIDAKMKQVLRELNAGIRMLADAEQVRRQTELTIMHKKYSRMGFGSLGAWAAGGGAQSKSFDQELEEAKANAISTHRENVLFYLRHKLQECGGLQASMMEKRISREMERNRSILGKSRLDVMPDIGGFSHGSVSKKATSIGHLEPQLLSSDEELTPEQIQMFEKENQDMLKHYESTLDQVRTAEKSLVEISELQNQLVHNLATQSAHIDQLVADSFLTTENIGGGNKQLKKATERKSTAKYVFYASCGLSLFLVVWDLVI